MATLTTASSGLRMIQFRINPRGRRITIRLGRVAESKALAVKSHIDELQSHELTQQPLAKSTAAWLVDLRQHGSRIYARLAACGLVDDAPVTEKQATSLAKFLDGYIKGRTDLKPQSCSNLEQCRNSLVAHFGEDCDLRTITKGKAQDWQRAAKLKFSAATVSGFVKKARMMFRNAVDHELIDSNPFAGLKAGKMNNPARQQYIPVDTVISVIDACPDDEWKLIFALARFGGLRTPSETFGLRWRDIHWDTKRILIHSPKTAHHEGKATREIPLFPELVPYLEAMPGAGDGHVIAQHRGENLRTQAERIIEEKAGLQRWPKLFQNLRSSFETDMTAIFPLHVACAWAGNSEAVAIEHYLQVPDAYFERAAKSAASPSRRIEVGGVSNPSHSLVLRFLNPKMPAVGAEQQKYLRDFLRVIHRAQANALRRLKQALPQMRRRDIRRLQSGMRIARLRVAKRGAR